MGLGIFLILGWVTYLGSWCFYGMMAVVLLLGAWEIISARRLLIPMSPKGTRMSYLMLALLISGVIVGVMLRQLDPAASVNSWMMWLVLQTTASDIGGLFAGKLAEAIGKIPGVKSDDWWLLKHPFRDSPKKTNAGLIGGLALAGLIAWQWVKLTSLPMTLLYFFPVIWVVAVFGDWIESHWKREIGIKNSAIFSAAYNTFGTRVGVEGKSLLRSHGGILDRVDSHIFSILLVGGGLMLFYYLVTGNWLPEIDSLTWF